jgi:hypothetical protein
MERRASEVSEAHNLCLTNFILQVAVMLLFIVAVTIAMVNLPPAVQHIYRAAKQQQSQGAWAAANDTFNELVSPPQ